MNSYNILMLLYWSVFTVLLISATVRKPAILMYSQLLLLIIFMYPSIYLIESGGFISEQNVYGWRNFLSELLFVFSVISLGILFFTINDYQIQLRDSVKGLRLYVCVWLLMVVTILYARSYNLTSSRFYFIDGNSGLESLVSHLYFVFVSFYIYNVMNQKALQGAFIVFLLALFVELIKGSEFSGQMVVFLPFLISRVLLNQLRIIPAVLIAIFSLSAILLYKFIILSGELDVFYNRITLQAHMLWGAVNHLNEGSGAFASLFEFRHSLNANMGLGELMYELAREYTSDFFADTVVFSSGFPSVFIYNYGVFIGLLVSFLLVYIYAKLIALYFRVSVSWGFVPFLLLNKFYSLLVLPVIYTGDLGVINITNIIYGFMLLMLIYFLTRLRRYKIFGLLL